MNTKTTLIAVATLFVCNSALWAMDMSASASARRIADEVTKLENNAQDSCYVGYGDQIIEALRKNTSVTKATVRFVDRNLDIVNVFRSRETPLEELTVGGDRGTPILILVEAVSQHPDALKKLEINTTMVDNELQELLSLLPKFTNLQRLEVDSILLSDKYKENFKQYKENFFAALDQMPNLKRIKFNFLKNDFSKEEMNAHGWFEKNSGYERK